MKNKVALIFGSGGQAGFYLSKLLEQRGILPVKISRTIGDAIGNVGDHSFVESLIKQYQPDLIFHLAANSTAAHSALFDNHEAICTGTLNILEFARLHCSSAKIFLSGSALQFKNEGLPINEQTGFEASSAYAVSRIQSVYAARYYRKAFGLRIYVGYFFNHDSPHRTEKHVNQKIAKAAQRIAQGSKEKLEIGNIDVHKEFNFSRDAMEAVLKLMGQENVFEAVIGSGKAYSIKDWASSCFEKLDLNWQDHIILQEGFVPEYKILVSDPKLILSLGWEPQVDFNQMVNMMIHE